MSGYQNAKIAIDSGQLRVINGTSTIKKPQTKLEVLNLRQNQQSNAALNICMNDKDNLDTKLVDNTVYNQQNNTNGCTDKKFFIIEVEFKKEKELSSDEYSSIILYVTKELLQAWTREKVIADAYNLDSNPLNKDYEVLDIWAIEPKIFKRKKYVKGEIII